MTIHLRLPLELSINTEPELLDIVHQINTAEKKDSKIILYCAGVGGSHDYTVMVLNAIIRSKVPVTVIVDSSCSSAHANIALSMHVDDLIIGSIGVVFMLHDMQIELAKDGSTRLVATAQNCKEEVLKFYHDNGILDLLTESELVDFYYNKEIKFSSTEIKQRLLLRDVRGFRNSEQRKLTKLPKVVS